MTDLAAADPMSGYRMFGRFLATGVGAGLAIGGLVGALAVYSPVDSGHYWTLALYLGAMLGGSTGSVAAVLICLVLHVVRRGSPGVRLRSQRGVIVVLASVTAFAAAWTLLQQLTVSTTHSVGLAGVAAGLAAAVAVKASVWCLAPLHTAGPLTRDGRPEGSTAEDSPDAW